MLAPFLASIFKRTPALLEFARLLFGQKTRRGRVTCDAPQPSRDYWVATPTRTVGFPLLVVGKVPPTAMPVSSLVSTKPVSVVMWLKAGVAAERFWLLESLTKYATK